MKMISKLNFKKFTSFLLAAVAVTSFYSCSDDDNGDSNSNNARIVVHMTDAPGEYEHVFVDVQDVRIKADASTSDEEGWVSLDNVNKGEVDLLSLTNGVTKILADTEVPVGNLDQIRVILGPDNFLVRKGETERIPLNTPSAQQSGLKLNVNQQLEAGKLYEYILDFDVDKSIVTAGASGGYILKPVIRLSTVEGTGKIEGDVHPFAVGGEPFQILVTATNANHTITAYTNASGGFVLHGVPAGTYRVTVTPETSSGYGVLTKSNVEVNSGATVDLETLDLE